MPQAELHQERAGLHEHGMADHELIGDDERDRFEGTSAMSPATAATTRHDRRRRRPTAASRARPPTTTTSAAATTRRSKRTTARRASIGTAPQERTDSPQRFRTPVSRSASASEALSGAEMWKPCANSQPSTLR